MKRIDFFVMFQFMSVVADLHGSSFLYLRRSEQQVPAASPKFMIISGSTAAAEMCLTAETDGVQAAGVGSWCSSVSPQMRLAMAESFSVGRMVKV